MAAARSSSPSFPERLSTLPPSSPTSERPSEVSSIGESTRDKRPRSDIDDDDEEQPPAKRKVRTFEQEIAYKGRQLGRILHLCADYGNLLEHGTPLSERDSSTLSEGENRRLRLYTALLLHYPNVKSDVLKCEERNVSTVPMLLKKGTASARGEDLNTLKTALPGWGILNVPLQKKMRGYNDPVCLKLLAPPNFPLDNPTVVEGIKSLDGPYALTPKHLPSFLYRNGVLVVGDIYNGLFLSELLIRAGLCILRGQESAMDGKGTKNTGKSVSERHKIKIVTPAFIAYTATLVRFTLSNQTTWSNSEGNGWKYHSFYKQLLKLLEEEMTNSTLQKIRSEWKSRMFGDNMDSDDDNDKELEDQDASSSLVVPDLRAMLIAQANREKEQEDIERRQAEAEARRQVEAANRALRDATNGGGGRR